MRRLALILGVTLLAVILSGCQTLSFYKQAIQGQYHIVSEERPIQKVLADTNTPVALKKRLELVLQLRQFAEQELKLIIDKQYAYYADLRRPFVVWDVYAAPEFSLESKKWWYPFVGRLEYRGYFSEKRALDYAAQLQKKNCDVYVGGVEAYSTLGWFKDPVLNTFIWNRNTDLADTLFHELAHQRVFAKGDTEFNEAFATAVAEEGVRRWLKANHDPETWERYQTEVKHDNDFVQLILSTRRKLRALYAEYSPTNTATRLTGSPGAQDRERRQKTQLIEQLRQEYQALRKQWGGYSGYDKWFEGPLNNAQLNTVSTYNGFVPAFQELMRVDSGNMEKFYQDAQQLTRLSKKQRHQRMKELLQAAHQESVTWTR